MTDEYTAQQRAAGKIGIAIGRLAAKYPYHANVLERFSLRERSDLPTMAVAASDKDVWLYYNTDFVLNLPADQLQGVFVHEIHHVVFRHIFQNVADFPDEWARIVAQEVSVNEFVNEALPDGAVVRELFPNLPPMESTRQRYERLKRVKKRIKLLKPQDWYLSGQGDASAAILDDHDVWQDAANNPEHAESNVRAVLQDALIEVGNKGLPKAMQKALRRWGIGNRAGTGALSLDGNGSGHLDWKHLLRRYVGRILRPSYVLHRPPRRYPELVVGVVPARSFGGGRAAVLAVIDTSGSISDQTLNQIDAELARLARCHEVKVVFCDCKIHAVFRYRKLRTVTGRGGTDFHPPLETKFLRQQRADLVVYFTDGFGDAPAAPPPVPVIWCLVPGGQCPAQWGRVISMGEHDEAP